ncbi:ABC transporter permease [Dictyobacter aurantiacus]|uniref:Choline ABC transporter permease n=1 Tax=Dictyobacter aurantiacus TaxID=1936993 RepID=A0A401ZAP5_9CHLR|nr:ABC transporter permease [Dictyobacter aurantiacus]GCE03876.1 choline ABC transporter permease [Dictyobacter aurantiacus]
MGDLINFIQDPGNAFAEHTIAYLQICAVSILFAIIIGVVLGVAVSRSAILSFIAVNLSGLMRAIPVIAFLIAALPYLGVGFKPTVVALIVLGIPPILLNTYTGIRGIDPSIIDAARGMGMTQWQIISRIQTPLVLPIIAAGIRTASVQIVATATLAAIIGAGGYGEYIIDGLNRLNNVAILAGAIPVAILAIAVELFMSWLQRALTPQGLRAQAQTNS